MEISVFDHSDLLAIAEGEREKRKGEEGESSDEVWANYNLGGM